MGDFCSDDVEAGVGLAVQDDAGHYLFFLAGTLSAPPGTACPRTARIPCSPKTHPPRTLNNTPVDKKPQTDYNSIYKMTHSSGDSFP